MTQGNPAGPPGAAVAKVKVGLGVPVNDMDAAFRLAQNLSLTELVPRALRGKAPDILAVLMYGSELGLSAWQSLAGIDPIEGRLTMSAELRVAKTRERGHRVGVVCVRCGEWLDHAVHETTRMMSDPDAAVPTTAGGMVPHRFEQDWSAARCTVKAQRGDTGEAAVVTWTIERAIAAGLVRRAEDGSLRARSKNNSPLPWELHTEDMLYARASSRAAKLIAPEVGYGTYTPDEVSEFAAMEREEADPVRCSGCKRLGHAVEQCPDVLEGAVVDADELRAMAAEHVGEPT